MNFSNRSSMRGVTSGTLPASTRPVEPSRVIHSPRATWAPLLRIVPATGSTSSPAAPATQHLPMPRATTAACDVIPPRAVRIPLAAAMPRMSSGLVSGRTRMTVLPSDAHANASCASNTTCPDAAPGEAGRPVAITVHSASGSTVGWSVCSTASGPTRWSASSSLMRPSSTMSTAIRIAAAPARLPFRVCSRYSLPRCTVNSRSCMSR